MQRDLFWSSMERIVEYVDGATVEDPQHFDECECVSCHWLDKGRQESRGEALVRVEGLTPIHNRQYGHRPVSLWMQSKASLLSFYFGVDSSRFGNYEKRHLLITLFPALSWVTVLCNVLSTWHKLGSSMEEETSIAKMPSDCPVGKPMSVFLINN